MAAAPAGNYHDRCRLWFASRSKKVVEAGMFARRLFVSWAVFAIGAIAISGTIAAAAATKPSFTLEQILSAPFPATPVAAPTGAKAAWVQNARGLRNIWVATAIKPGPAETPARQITHFMQDDGVELGELAWTPDARSIVFVRGGVANNPGEHPNPSSNPAGAEQSLWIVSAEGGEPRKLALGSSPEVSPRGDRVAYINKGQIWVAALNGSPDPHQLVRTRGRCDSLRWSPDGSLLAFVCTRTDHSFIGLYDAARHQIRWLDPSVDRDEHPCWSPDGKRIAFVRIPASKLLFTFGPHRAAEPWSIRVASVSDGAGREVWRAAEGPGSVFQALAAESQLFWMAGDKLIFPWERDGWIHLYTTEVEAAAGAAAQPARLLSPGNFEVEYAALAPDRTKVLFNSNQDDIDRRHLWSVTTDAAAPTQLTSGAGIEWSPAMLSNGDIAFLRSDGRRPAHAAILARGQSHDLASESLPRDFPESQLVEPQSVIFPAADGLKIHGQLFVPRDVAESQSKDGKRAPAILFFHGGSRRQMLLGWHCREYYHNAYAMNQYLASRGYVVLSVNYRSGTGYGLEFREAENYGAHGASEFNDVLGAGLYLRNLAYVDPQRIGLWGGSYGGYLTAMGLARASDLFAAGVDLHGVHDWNVVIRNFAPTYDPKADQEMARRAFESSPMASVSSWRSPVLLVHGDDDRNVPFSETVNLVEALRKQRVPVEQLIFPDEVHGFLMYKHWLKTYGAAAEFFDRRIGGK
jgi:dipeptidyl aminopeptidase/acylaminoacyl peptidase